MKRHFLLLFLVVLSLNLFCQVHWTKHPDSVLETGSDGSFDQDWIGLPCVLLVDDTLRMWYSGAIGPAENDTRAVGYATSTDGGLTWTKYDQNPVLEPGPAGSWDERYVMYATVLYHDFTYHMWYVGKNFSDPEAKGYATSPDGIHWTKYEGNPIDKDLTPGGVLFKDNLYHMWYNDSGTCYGTSDDGINWTKYEGNPVIAPGPFGSWDRPRLQPHSVIYDGQKYHLWYSGGAFGSWQIGYATSLDGINWSRYEGNPVLPKGPPGSFDASFTFFSSVIFDDFNSLYKMWYQAGPGGIGYAESEIYEPAWELMNYLDPGGMTCVVDSLIYSFSGGWEGWGIGDETWYYNTNSNQWIQLTDMPIPMTEGGIGHIGGKIYLVGGWILSASGDWITVDSILEYDIAADTYSFKKKSGTPIGSGADCVMDEKIFLFGGWGSPVPDVQHAYEGFSYDPDIETWDDTFCPDMQYPHLMHGSAEVLDGNIYVIGGVCPNPFDPQRSEMFDGENWVPIAEMPVPMTLHKSTVHDGKILVFGGDSLWTGSKSYSTNFIQEYDPDTDTWRMMEPMPFQRTAMEGGKVGNYMYLIGGTIDQRDPFSGYVTEVWRFNLDSLKEWAVPCNEVMVSESTLNLEIDQTSTLSASVMPTYAADRTVSWSSSDEGIATVTAGGEVTAVSEGEATITAIANGGGCTATCSLTVSSGVGISILKADQISVFPNPVIDFLHIRTGLSEYHVIEISYLNGEILYNMATDRPTYQFDLSSLSKGVYFVTVRSRDFVTTRKVIKL